MTNFIRTSSLRLALGILTFVESTSMKKIEHAGHFLITVIYWFVQKHFLDYLLTKLYQGKES